MAENHVSAPAGVHQSLSYGSTNRTALEEALGDLNFAATLLELYLTQGMESDLESLNRKRYGHDKGVVMWLSKHIEEHVATARDAFYGRLEPDDLGGAAEPEEDDPEPPDNAAPGPDDPHCAWKLELDHVRVDHHHRPDDDESDRLYDRMCELRRLICTTPPTTLDGLTVQLGVMFDELWPDGGGPEELAEAWRLSHCFIGEVHRALDRLGMTQEVERECWKYRARSAPMWRDHPAMPADLKAEVAKTPDPYGGVDGTPAA